MGDIKSLRRLSVESEMATEHVGKVLSYSNGRGSVEALFGTLSFNDMQRNGIGRVPAPGDEIKFMLMHGYNSVAVIDWTLLEGTREAENPPDSAVGTLGQPDDIKPPYKVPPSLEVVIEYGWHNRHRQFQARAEIEGQEVLLVVARSKSCGIPRRGERWELVPLDVFPQFILCAAVRCISGLEGAAAIATDIRHEFGEGDPVNYRLKGSGLRLGRVKNVEVLEDDIRITIDEVHSLDNTECPRRDVIVGSGETLTGGFGPGGHYQLLGPDFQICFVPEYDPPN